MRPAPDTFKEFHASLLNELFEKPLHFVRKVDAPKTYSIGYVYAFDPKAQTYFPGDESRFHGIDRAEQIQKAEANTVTVQFFYSHGTPKDVEVTFYRGGTTKMTGEGSASVVIASVLDAIKRYTKEYDPNTIGFGVVKRQSKIVGRTSGRLKAYKALIKRYAASLGFKMKGDNEDDYFNTFTFEKA